MAAARRHALLRCLGVWLLAAPATAQPAGGASDSAVDTVRSGPAPASLIPFPILFYQPETGFGFGGSGGPGLQMSVTKPSFASGT